MRQFLIHMSLPTAILLVTVWIVTKFGLPGDSSESYPSAEFLSDPKLKRTIVEMHDTSDNLLPERLRPVDRPGMLFRISMPEQTHQRFRSLRNSRVVSKMAWTSVSIAIDECAKLPALVRIHGNTSIEYDRKSFNVNLLSCQRFDESFQSSRIYLLNLVCDPAGFEMRVCNLLLNRLNHVPLYNQLAIVEINSQPQGLYLAIERPQDAIRRHHDGVLSVIRTRQNSQFEEKYFAAGIEPRKILKLVGLAMHIDDKQHQADELERLIDLDAYMTWMAFNSVIQNADCRDELYLFEICDNPTEIGRLGIMGWDYDDIQQEPAHPELVTEDPLCWAAEAWLDETILSNPILYDRYKSLLKKLLQQQLTDEIIDGAIRQVQDELDKVFMNIEPAEMAQSERNRTESMAQFRESLLSRKKTLLDRLGLRVN